MPPRLPGNSPSACAPPTPHAGTPGQLTYRSDDRGATAPSRRASKYLAAMIRERVDFETIVDRLADMARGRDPATGQAIDVNAQLAAIRTLFERGFGQPMQSIHIEAQVSALAQVTPDTRDAMEDLDDAQLEALERLGIGLGSVIDAESPP